MTGRRYPWRFNTSLKRIAVFQLLYIFQFITASISDQPATKSGNPKYNCYKTSNGFPRLTSWQTERCIKDPRSFAAAIQGARQAEYECKRLFQKERWNCTGLIEQFQDSLKEHYETPTILAKSYKETAFSHAILAAGITHAVANACRRDKLPKSPCNAGDNPNGYDQNMSRSQRKKFEKEGANNDLLKTKQIYDEVRCMDKCVDYGRKTASDFMKLHITPRAKTALEYFGYRNQDAGQVIVHKSQHRKCKCMGPTGLCTWEVCWKTMPAFPTIAERVHKQFKMAQKLNYDNTKYNIELENILGKYKQTNLFYMARSPDFCDADRAIGFLGNENRQCSLRRKKDKGDKKDTDKHKPKRKRHQNKKDKRKDKKKKDHRNKEFDLPKCKRKKKSLCCNGYEEQQVAETYQCKCKFHWCCHIECAICSFNSTIGVCN